MGAVNSVCPSVEKIDTAYTCNHIKSKTKIISNEQGRG